MGDQYLNKTVTASNITYLVNYGRVPKIGENGGTLVALKDLAEYYDNQQRETDWKKKLGADLNWNLAFENYTESQTTKHASQLKLWNN